MSKKSKVGCIFRMVIWLESRMGQQRGNNHREEAPLFTTRGKMETCLGRFIETDLTDVKKYF